MIVTFACPQIVRHGQAERPGKIPSRQLDLIKGSLRFDPWSTSSEI